MTTLLDRFTRATSMRIGRTDVANVLQIKSKHASTCPTCQGQRITNADELVGRQWPRIAHKLEHAFRSQSTVGGTQDPAPWLAATSLCRALALHAHGALEGKDVLLLGDDDLVSLAIGFLGQALGRSLARRIVVVEADPTWIDLIRRISDREDLGIECVLHDLRDPLPEALTEQFDTFETDPPDTTAGLALFVSRAIQALRPGAGQQGLLSCGHKPRDEVLDVQAHLVRMGLVAHKVIPAFDESQDASSPGASSQMMYLVTTPATKALVPQAPYEGAIYGGEASPTVQFYVCTRCKARYRVGQQVSPVEIESLKAAGCTRCGHTRFRYVQRIAVEPNRLPAIATQGLPSGLPMVPEAVIHAQRARLGQDWQS